MAQSIKDRIFGSDISKPLKQKIQLRQGLSKTSDLTNAFDSVTDPFAVNLDEHNFTEGGGKNIDLLPSELEGTWVYPGTDLSERIFDYEDRIEFLTTDSEEDPTNSQIQKDLATLNNELEALYTERDASDQEGNITPEYDDQGQRIK